MSQGFVKLIMGAVSMSLSACAGEPKSLLDQLIKDKKFIPFEMPMESTRVGTLLRGNAQEMYLVARPEKCFPDLEGENSLRWLQATNLPQQFQKIEFSANANADLNGLMGIGNDTVTFKANIQNVRTIEIQFKGALVEFLEEGNFLRHYGTEIGEECRRLLQYAPFIAQGLRIEAMSFVFRDEKKGEILLDGKVHEFVDIAAGVKWHIQNNYSLVVETPKYIGYRMGMLEMAGNQASILYASTANAQGEWIFRRLNDARGRSSQTKSQTLQIESRDQFLNQKLQRHERRVPQVFPAEPLF